MTDKPLPQNIEAEQAVLGAIIIEGSIISQVPDILTPDDFYETRNQVLFRCLINMYNQDIHIDISTVYEELKSQGLLEQTGDFLYLSHLTEIVVSTANVMYFAKKVKKTSERRKLWEKSERLNQAVLNDADDEVIMKLQNAISEIISFSGFQLDKLSLQPSDLENIPRYDLIEGFLPKGSLILLSGKYGAGKSVLSLSVAKRLLERGESVVYIDADMPLQVVDERLDKSGLKSRLGTDFFYPHRSKFNMKIGDKVWHQFLWSMKGKRHHVIILDNLKDLMPAKMNINLDSDIMFVMNEVKTLRDFGHTVLLLHHWGKDGSVENPFKNNASIGDSIDVGYTIQKDEDGAKFILHCFKDRFPVKTYLAFEVSDDFELVEVATPEFEKMIDDIKLIHETMLRLQSEGVEIHQNNVIEKLKGILSKNRSIDLLRRGENKTWDVIKGNRKTLIYTPRSLKIQNSEYIYRRIFGIMENGELEEGRDEPFEESLPEFL